MFLYVEHIIVRRATLDLTYLLPFVGPKSFVLPSYVSWY